MKEKKIVTNKNLIWNVYREDFNTREIEIFNVFDHASFNADVVKLLKNKELTREEFFEQLRRNASYYFWAKCEYEVVITSWPPHITKEELDRLNSEKTIYRYMPNLQVEKKIDIYEQLKLNWERFVEYCWSFRK